MKENANKNINTLSNQERRLLLKNLIQKKIENEKVHPLSFAQERLWFLDQFYPDSPAYNIPAAIPLPGPLNIKALEDSLHEIVRRHEALRTTFRKVNGTLKQIISPTLNFSMSVVDLRDMPDSSRDAEAQRLAAQEAQSPFDLTKGPLIRCTLLRLADMNHVLILTMHHIISDGWSMRVFFQELSSLYIAFSAGRPSPLPELPMQYSDFAIWQRQWLQSDTLNNLLGYWKKQLAGAPTILELPIDRPRPARQTFYGSFHYFKLPEHQTQGLRDLARQEESTLFMVLLSIFAVLLNRYTHQDDMLIGSPIANRTRPEIEGLIGFLVNMLVLRSDLSGRPEYRQFLRRTREMALGAYAHQDLPFERLVEEIQPERNLSHNPMIQVMFVFQNQPTSTPSSQRNENSESSDAPPQTGTGTSKFDLTLFIMEGAKGLTAGFEYNLALFEASTIERMAQHYGQLVESILSDPDQPISSLPLLTNSERWQIVEEWNETEEDYPTEICIHELFEEQVEKTPDAIAIESDGQQLIYEELNERANQLAHYLLKKGVGPDVCVGLCMDRSAEMMVAILGILKAGGAYAPLDPAYPVERLEYMLNDSEASIVLSQKKHKAKLGKTKAKFIDLEKSGAAIKKEKKENCQSAVRSDNLAYVIYTSGSTGKPKGVAIEHHSTATLINWAKDFYEDDQLSGVLASTSVCFDLSVYEMFTPLSNGGTIIMVENILHLPDCAAKDQVTLINTVPSGIASLMKLGIPNSVNTINLAGEPLSNPLAQRIYEQNPSVKEVINLYGPSEDTTYSTVALIEKGSEEKVTIGRPIANTQIYILDKNGNPTPVGVVGEIFISGDGLAREYLHKPELTAEKFIPNPFDEDASSRMYGTGDLARYTTSGDIEFIGRVDHQIKLRGFRIELGEIETTLKEHHLVSTAIVMAPEDEKLGRRLVAYVKPAPSSELIAKDLRLHLSEKLPHYMHPATIVLLDEMPLLPNGKINRKALLASTSSEPENETEYLGPRNVVEEVLVDVWENVLGVEKVGVFDNFFEVGGQSLIATQVVSRIQDIFKIHFPIHKLFEKPTIAGLAENLLQNPDYDQRKIEKTADMLIQLANLSESEVEQLLQKKLSSTEK